MATADEYAVAAWGYQLTRPDGTKQSAGSALIDTLFTAAAAKDSATVAAQYAKDAGEQVRALSTKMDALLAASEQILAAIQGAEFPVSGTVHIGTT
jgi:hypothetical protein